MKFETAYPATGLSLPLSLYGSSVPRPFSAPADKAKVPLLGRTDHIEMDY